MDHADELTYLDRPRLFSGDHKASNLRGERKIEDLDEYIGEHEDFSVLVRRYYDCQAHLKSVDHLFERLLLPHQNVTITSKIRPYLFSLAQDSEEAMWESEEMQILSPSLTRTLSTFQIESHTTIEAPYVSYYHQRGPIAESLPGKHDEALENVASYIDHEYGEHFHKADALFSKGNVSLEHFDKLFKAGDVVVMDVEGNLQAYECISVDSTGSNGFSMDCMSWTFDGSFRQSRTTRSVTWPVRAEGSIRIQDLDLFPLRFANDGTEKRLMERGLKFWGFRTRKYVSYRSDSIDPDGHTAKPRYMIDMRTYQEMHQNEPEPNPHVGEARPMTAEKPDKTFLLLLPPTVLGFGLHDKKWSKSARF